MNIAQTKILLVDDEPDILEFISYNLKKEGYQVFTAASGKDAITIADSVFASSGKRTRLQDKKSHTLHFGKLMDGEESLTRKKTNQEKNFALYLVVPAGIEPAFKV